MKHSIQMAIELACQELFDEDIQVELTRPEPQFGDFATNVALQLAKPLGKSPRDIAQTLIEGLQNISEVQKVEVAGPGFINLTVSDTFLMQSLSSEPEQLFAGKKVLVEYSQPNPFKPLHAGHLYTTLVGDVIARLVENAGAETVRLNYGGDVGRHVGISMRAIVKNLGGEDIDAVKAIHQGDLPAWMGKMYVEGTAAFDDEESVQFEVKVASKKVYALHADNDHESPFAQIYWYLREQSYEFFKKLYVDLQVTPFDRFIPESEVTPLGMKTVQEQKAKGVFKDSNGAVVFEGEEFGLHTRVFINSEGLPTYEAKDVGLSLTKWHDYPNFDLSIITTGNEQAQYMQVVMKAIEQFAPEPARRTKHLTNGMVKLTGGVKMSSRKGNILSANDILDAARAAGAESGQATTEEVVLASVKYALIKSRIGGDIIYDPKESIATEGNSGPYLQYAHARASSILSKAAIQPQIGIDLDDEERTLVRKLTQYAETVGVATQELAPHHICTYLYELAQTFNRFYEKSHVIGNDREAHRLALVKTYAETLKKGLNLLGIHAPEKM
jgi:arginyl-tRNA synthetase